VDLSSYTPIYVRTTGNDSTADGSLALPFRTIDAAYAYAYSTVNNLSNTVFDLGAGSFGGLTPASTLGSYGNYTLIVRGDGAQVSFLGGIDYYNNNSSANTTIYVISNNSVNIGDVLLNTANSSGNNPYYFNATDAVLGNINTSAGDGGIDGGNVYNGGNVYLTGCYTQDIISNGENSGSDPSGGGVYNGGSGGNVYLTNSNVWNISINGGNGGVPTYPNDSYVYGGAAGTLSEIGTCFYVSLSNSVGADGGCPPSGGYDGTHYTCGVADSYTGEDYDYYDGFNVFWYNGSCLNGAYNGTLYGNPSGQTGFFF
jgi:hypothetical protein